MDTPSSSSAPGEPRGVRVLVVDDDKDGADSLAVLLRAWGYEVRVLYDGWAVISTATTFKPHVALLDLGLPGVDGYQLALQLRREPALQGTILVAVTGHQWKNAQERSREYGFDDHLVKPVELERLQSMLHVLAERRTGSPGEAESTAKAQPAS